MCVSLTLYHFVLFVFLFSPLRLFVVVLSPPLLNHKLLPICPFYRKLIFEPLSFPPRYSYLFPAHKVLLLCSAYFHAPSSNRSSNALPVISTSPSLSLPLFLLYFPLPSTTYLPLFSTFLTSRDYNYQTENKLTSY